MEPAHQAQLFKTFSIFVILAFHAAAAVQDEVDRLMASARADQVQSRFPNAEQQFRRAVELMERRGGEADPRLPEALNGLGVARYYLGARGEAAALYGRALALFEQHGVPSLAWAAALKNLATSERERSRSENAERLCRRSLAMVESVTGAENGAAEPALAELALIASHRGDYQSARDFIERAIVARTHDPGAALESAATLIGIRAEILAAEGKYSEAEPQYRLSLRQCSRNFGPESLQCTAALHGLSEVLKARGASGEAEEFEQRAVNIFERTYGPQHPRMVAGLNMLGTLADANGDYKRAQKLLERAAAMSRSILGPEHPDTATVLMNLAGVYVHRRKFERAEDLYQQALRIDEANHGPLQKLGVDANNLGVFYFLTKRFGLAERSFRRAVDLHEQAFGPDHIFVAGVLANLAATYDHQGRGAEAANVLARAIRIWDQHPSVSTPARAGALLRYAKLMRKADNYAEANRAEAEAMRVRVKNTLANEPSKTTLLP